MRQAHFFNVRKRKKRIGYGAYKLYIMTIGHVKVHAVGMITLTE